MMFLMWLAGVLWGLRLLWLIGGGGGLVCWLWGRMSRIRFMARGGEEVGEVVLVLGL